jgi:hypothetical protein
MGKKLGLSIGLLAAALAVGAGLFYAGSVYGRLQASRAAAPFAGPAVVGEAEGGAIGFITSIQGSTLQVRSGQHDTTVTLSAGTSVLKTVTMAGAGLQVGDQVTVQGARDAAGGLAASLIHVVPAGASYSGFGGRGPNAITIEFVPATTTPAAP